MCLIWTADQLLLSSYEFTKVQYSKGTQSINSLFKAPIFAGMPKQENAPTFPEFVHPVTKEKLIWDDSGKLLFDKTSSDTFPVIDDLPILLPFSRDLNEAEKKYETHYQIDAEEYDYFSAAEGQNERAEIERLHQHIISEIPASAKTILDVGCGGGWLANALLPKGKTVISMDVSIINPQKTLKNFPHPNHFGLVADALYLPLREGSIDCIVASEIIEHVPDPAKFLGSIYTALAPGGKLIVTTPYNELIRYSLCIHCNQNTPHNAHLHSFKEESLIQKAPKQAINVRTQIINAKVFSLLRVLTLMDFLPYSVYKTLDRIAITLTRKKAYRIMLTLEKPSKS